MNPAQLLEHFDRISEAPDAVARLRRFILDLAVRGKLVEPTGSVKLVPLASLCTSTSGNGKMIKGTLSAEFGEGLYPCFSASGQDVWHETFEHEGEAVIVSAVGARCGKAFLATGKWSAIANTHILFPKQDVCSLAYLYLIANNEALWIRGGSAQPFVKVAATLKERLVYFPPFAEQNCIVAKVDELMALCAQLEAARNEREARRDQLVAASLNRIGTAPADKATTEAPSPTPLRDAARFHLDHLPRLTTRPEHIEQLRQTILNLAVRGRLVPQDPNDEPAAKLLELINTHRDQLLNSDYPNVSEARSQLKKQLTQVVPDGLERLPSGWQWATLMQCSALIVDCHNKTAPYSQTGIPLIRTTNVRDGKLNLNEPKFVDEPTYARWSARCEPEPGDILITREAPMGEVAVIPGGMKICLGQRMMLARLVPKTIDPQFMLYSLRDPLLMNRVQDKPVGATVQHLRVGGVETLLIPVPPLAEQHRIVAKVDELMALCDQLEAQLTATQSDSRRLLEAVLHEALAPSLEKAA